MYKNIFSATKHLGVMPMVKHCISELKIHHIFGKHIPMKPNEKLPNRKSGDTLLRKSGDTLLNYNPKMHRINR
jgi:hypothetical protein